MFSKYKILDYLIPILAGLIILTFALVGIKKQPKMINKRKEIVKNVILAILMIILSIVLIFM